MCSYFINLYSEIKSQQMKSSEKNKKQSVNYEDEKIER